MNRLLRILHWKARAKFWQRRCAKAEERAAELAAQLDAEVWRNRAREDTFISATIMGGRQMYGVAPRSGPAATTQPQRAVPAPSSYDGFTGTDRMEFETIWLPDAERNGVDPRVAKATFMAELANRRAHPDVM